MAKRSAPPSASSSQPAPKKAATSSQERAKAALPSTSSTPNNWRATQPSWGEELPQGEFGRLSVETWCLLAPYDSAITEKQWRSYYLERSSNDNVLTSLTPPFERIESEDLGTNTATTIRAMASAISSEMYGVAGTEEERIALARTMRGAVYLLSLEGVHDDSAIRTVEVQSRLYSPYGIGTSIDFSYYFHHRPRAEPVEFNTWLLASPRTIADCQPSRPTFCSALRKTGNGASENAVKVFRCSGDTKPIGSAVRSLAPLATHLFGSPLWISPRKLLSLFLASAAILSYFDEDNAETVQHVLTKRDLAASFDDELPQEVLKERAKRDEEEMVVLEDKMDEEALGEMDLEGAGRTREEVKSVCLSERGLLLARRDWVAKHGERKETGEGAQQAEGAEGEGAEKVKAWAEEVVRG